MPGGIGRRAVSVEIVFPAYKKGGRSEIRGGAPGRLDRGMYHLKKGLRHDPFLGEKKVGF